MSKKKYEIDGKYYDFNNKKFKEIVEKFSAKNNKSKRKIYMDFAKFCGMHFDSYKTIEKWASTDVGPRDVTFFKSIADFFKVGPEAFLDEVKDYVENKIEGVKKVDFKKIQSNDIKQEPTNVKKFNSVQISEFIRIKDCILDYLYTYYSPYMNDIELFDGEENFYYTEFKNRIRINGEDIKPFYKYCENVVKSITDRLYDKNDIINVKKFFSNDEIEEIEKAIENKEKYEEIEEKQKINIRKYGLINFIKNHIDSEDLLEKEEVDFLNNNRLRMGLLYEYEMMKKIGHKIVLRQEVDKTLSILPYEVFKTLVILIDILPSPDWQEEYDNYEWYKDRYNYNNYNIDEVILIDEYEKCKKKEAEIVARMTNEDINTSTYEIDEEGNSIPVHIGYNQLREDEIKAAKLPRGGDGYDELIYSINNRVMNVHRILNDIMKKYID